MFHRLGHRIFWLAVRFRPTIRHCTADWCSASPPPTLFPYPPLPRPRLPGWARVAVSEGDAPCAWDVTHSCDAGVNKVLGGHGLDKSSISAAAVLDLSVRLVCIGMKRMLFVIINSKRRTTTTNNNNKRQQSDGLSQWCTVASRERFRADFPHHSKLIHARMQM